jgi:hypothetical protein
MNDPVMDDLIAERTFVVCNYLLLFSNIMTLSKKKKNSKKVSITLIFTLACSDFFWNFKTFFLKGHYY